MFVVMLMWTLDQRVNPAHAGKTCEVLYSISGLTSSVTLLPVSLRANTAGADSLSDILNSLPGKSHAVSPDCKL